PPARSGNATSAQRLGRGRAHGEKGRPAPTATRGALGRATVMFRDGSCDRGAERRLESRPASARPVRYGRHDLRPYEDLPRRDRPGSKGATIPSTPQLEATLGRVSTVARGDSPRGRRRP